MNGKGECTMATIKRTVHVGDKPSDKAIREVRDAAKRPITYDDDAPEISDEDYARMAKLARKRKEDDQRVPVGLRIKRKTLNKAKATGKGYTGFLARLIDNAIDDEDLVKKSL